MKEESRSKKPMQTVRLTPNAATALNKLAASAPAPLTKVLEAVLVEAAHCPPRLPVSKQEINHIGFVYEYLIQLSKAHSPKINNDSLESAQIGLSAKTAAMTLKRIFAEADGRIKLLRP